MQHREETSEQIHYFDYEILQKLLPRFGKKDIATLVDQEYELTYSSVHPKDACFFLAKMHEEGILRNEIEKYGMYETFLLESMLIEVLYDMEKTGILLDRKKLLDIGTRINRDVVRTEGEIYALVGEIFNINSPKQVQGILFEKLQIPPKKKNKTGYSVDNEVLSEIAHEYDIARLILEYRSLTKLDGTYVSGLLKSIGNDGRIHTRYDALGAATGRMSSNDPNLQNIPAGDGYAREIKECFIAREGYSLVVADYSQIELRILAFLSEDEALLSAFENEEDIHMRTAKFLFGEGANITQHERRIAKSVNFGVIYGITGFGLAKTLEVSPWEAQKYIEAFYEKYPGVRTYYDTLLLHAREQGFVETYFGRRRYIPGVNDANKTLRSMAEREAMNMPIQGTAADIIKIAMIDIFAKIREIHISGNMLLQVHDELVFEVKDSDIADFCEIVKSTMEGILMKKQKGQGKVPPLTVDIGIGKNWAEAK